MGSITPWEGALLVPVDRSAHCKVWAISVVSCAQSAEPIDLPFGLWTRVGLRKHKFKSYSLGGTIANVQSLEDTLRPPGEYD